MFSIFNSSLPFYLYVQLSHTAFGYQFYLPNTAQSGTAALLSKVIPFHNWQSLYLHIPPFTQSSLCCMLSSAYAAESPLLTLQLNESSKSLLHWMVTWLRKAEVPVRVWKAVTCPVRAQSNRKLQPGQEAEYAWVTPVCHVDSHQGTPSPRQPSRLLPANSSWEMKMQNNKPLPCGIFPRGLAFLTQTISSTIDFIEMTKTTKFNLFSSSSSMASPILQPILSGCKATQSCRMGKVLKIHEVVPVFTSRGSRPLYLMRAG